MFSSDFGNTPLWERASSQASAFRADNHVSAYFSFDDDPSIRLLNSSTQHLYSQHRVKRLFSRRPSNHLYLDMAEHDAHDESFNQFFDDIIFQSPDTLQATVAPEALEVPNFPDTPQALVAPEVPKAPINGEALMERFRNNPKDDPLLLEWYMETETPDEMKELVDQVLKSKAGFAFGRQHVERICSIIKRDLAAHGSFHEAFIWAIWWNLLAPTSHLHSCMCQITARYLRPPRCPHFRETPRPHNSHLNLRGMLMQVLEGVWDHWMRTCTFKFPPSEHPLYLDCVAENARRVIEWHRLHGEWRAGWIFYNDEIECKECANAAFRGTTHNFFHVWPGFQPPPVQPPPVQPPPG